MLDPRARRTAFAKVADEYDRGRPGYPDELFDALGPLEGLRVLDIGAGTGIAARPLDARGARVVAIDPSIEMLGRAVDRSPTLAAVVADGARLPVRNGSVELVTFGQSWHWLDPASRCDEMHRVLVDGGRWAAWWSHARGVAWLDRYWDLIEAACPRVVRTQRDIDWGADVRASGRFDVPERTSFSWSRPMSIDDALTNDASHSHIAALEPPARDRSSPSSARSTSTRSPTDR